MVKNILITGATDGIGLATAKTLASLGHTILLHGRNEKKLEKTKAELSQQAEGKVECYLCDLSDLNDVKHLTKEITQKHSTIDVLINNAGVLRTEDPITKDGLDIRFAVNTIAPYLLTQELLPLMNPTSRVINLSSAAQAPIDTDLLIGKTTSSDELFVYAQSKLAITMWSHHLGNKLKDKGPIIIAVNPGSMLGSKMVKEGFGVEGGDIQIGADILTRAALSDEFTTAAGMYFDNDEKQFSSPHIDALDQQQAIRLLENMTEIIEDKLY